MSSDPIALPTPLPGPLPLFPLQLVLFPGALLGLKIFEARYLDLVSECMRSGEPFGVVCLRQGSEAGRHSDSQMEAVGTLAHIDEVDAEQPGILRLRCHGGQRFKITAKATQRDNGLWVAPLEMLREDPSRAPGPAVQATVQALADAIQKLQEQDHAPFAPPYKLDDAGWVANRWCELLPISLGAKQKLMELDDPVIRLSLVDGYLRDKKVVVGSG
jgi:uncharacterized protein